MAQDVDIAVIGLHAEIHGGRRVPLVLDIPHLIGSLTKRKPDWALITPISGIALHLDWTHKKLPSATFVDTWRFAVL